MGWNEERLHRWLRKVLPAVPAGWRGVGGDAALLSASRDRQALTTDQVIEGVHFLAAHPPRKIGHKAVARTLSDLAAVAATPRAILLTLRAPSSESEARIRHILRGAMNCAAFHGAPIVGGDIAEGKGPLSLAVSALGSVPRGLRPPDRAMARPGHLLLLTGPVGGSLRGRHLTPVPRLKEGLALARAGARGMIDISDGLARDAGRMAAASGVRLQLTWVPIHRAARLASRRSSRTALHHALHDGEDHELLASMPPRRWAQASSRLRALIPGITPIGSVLVGRGVEVPRAEGDGHGTVAWSGHGGWVHGG